MSNEPQQGQSPKANAIVIFADENYFPLALVLARSAMEAAGNIADVFIFADSAHLAARYAGSGLIVRHVDLAGRLPANAVSYETITQASYYRLFLGDLLPDTYSRALYLDCDVAVEPGFGAIFSHDMQGAALAAAVDGGDILRRSGEHAAAWRKHLTDIGLPADAPYFNAGVLLIDLAAWRKADVVAASLAFLAEYGALATAMDQDALNVVFRGRWQELSPRWNFQFPYMGLGVEGRADPQIWHYSGHIKPWHDLLWPHERSHVERFRKAFAGSDWPDFLTRSRKLRHRAILLRRLAKDRLALFRGAKLRKKAARLAEQRANVLAMLEQAPTGAKKERPAGGGGET